MQGYKDELLAYVQRMAEMEEIELKRMAGEITSIEERAANHGKQLDYFKVPKLGRNTKKRRMSFAAGAGFSFG